MTDKQCIAIVRAIFRLAAATTGNYAPSELIELEQRVIKELKSNDK
jgi:hypothetical protein